MARLTEEELLRLRDMSEVSIAEIAVKVDMLVGFADFHTGCRMGLCPTDGAKLDEGGRYMPSNFQQKLYGLYERVCTKWLPEITHGRRWGVVFDGDAIDGVHHNSVTQWSHNLTDQGNAAYELLAPLVEMCDGRYWHIRGTEAHAGKSGQYEEALARRLGAIPNEDGQYARYDLWKWLGDKQFLTHWTHHIGGTSSVHYESTAVFKEMVRGWVEAGRWGSRPPDAFMRAHRHREFAIPVTTRRGGKRNRAWVCVLPGWQGKTPLAYRIAGATQAPPQFGAKAVYIRADNALDVLDWTYDIPPSEPE